MKSKKVKDERIWLTRDQCRAADHYAIHDLGILGVVLMENAGRNAADLIERRLRSRLKDTNRRGKIAIICGRGNNGGDGFVIARHLFHRGYNISVDLFGDPNSLANDAAINYAIAVKMGISIRPLAAGQSLSAAARRWRRCNVIVDALLGTGFAGEVREPLASVLRRINALDGPLIVAVDVPSGLDADTGIAGGVAVQADDTVTFLAAKVGCRNKSAKPYIGRLTAVDIGAPTRLILDRLKEYANPTAP